MNTFADFAPYVSSYEPDPAVRKFHLTLPKPTLEDPVGDIERVLAGLADTPGFDIPIDAVALPIRFVRRAGRILRDASFEVTAVLAQVEGAWELIDLVAGDQTQDAHGLACYGLAVDVGTTTVSFYLVNMTRGEIAGTLALDNPQGAHGEDILSRIHFCQRPGGLQTLRDAITACINDGLHTLAENNQLDPHAVYAVSVAGNPAMMHLLLGLDPYHLCREPYVPVCSQVPSLRAQDLMLDVHPDAPVYVFPGLGSYFGGDVVAGILASGMHTKHETSLLVDVGTNAEIVLGNREWLVVCAGAAGPALESGGVKAGMRATDGAIERVRIDKKTFESIVQVIGGGPARGICGSGVIDLVAELYLAGMIDPRGRIRERHKTPRIVPSGDVRGYAVALAERREASKDIVIDELDIGNLLRAKGAMYTALTLITERLGVGFQELESFFVAGSFGEHIDPRNAVIIGMMPDIPAERFRVLGNSAGLGACLLLLSHRLREDVEHIRRKTAYIQLTTENEFMTRLSAAIFIPHTDRNLFPTVP